MRVLTTLAWISPLVGGLLGCASQADPISCPSINISCDGRATAAQYQGLVDRAWNEYVQRGGKIARSGAVVSVTDEGSRIRVFHQFVPASPGGFFVVEFDSSSRDIVRYFPGH